jgi:small subunit ribosomal protein S6
MGLREYELVYVIQPDASTEREQEIARRIDEVIAGSPGADILIKDDWGKRKLAYEIQKFQKGHYLQVNYLGQGSEVREIERRLRIDPDVLRFLTVQVSDDVRDVEARRKEAAEQAAIQARRRQEREREREERERRDIEESVRGDLDEEEE